MILVGLGLIFLLPIIGMVLLGALGIVLGVRRTAGLVLGVTGAAGLVALLVLYSFVSWVEGIFR